MEKSPKSFPTTAYANFIYEALLWDDRMAENEVQRLTYKNTTQDGSIPDDMQHKST